VIVAEARPGKVFLRGMRELLTLKKPPPINKSNMLTVRMGQELLRLRETACFIGVSVMGSGCSIGNSAVALVCPGDGFLVLPRLMTIARGPLGPVGFPSARITNLNSVLTLWFTCLFLSIVLIGSCGSLGSDEFEPLFCLMEINPPSPLRRI